MSVKRRVEKELRDLCRKIGDLEAFLAKDSLKYIVTDDQADLLVMQVDAMKAYAVILEQRLGIM